MEVNPKEYYQSLDRQEKSKFLTYVAQKVGISPITLSGKLRENPRSHLKYEEGKMLEQIIKSNEWR